jgi:hypothetical protein
MKKVLGIVLLIGALAACDPAWEDMTPGSGPDCGVVTTVAYSDGDFFPGQIQDMQSALGELVNWSQVPLAWGGATPWRWNFPNRPKNLIVIERRTAAEVGAGNLGFSGNVSSNHVYTGGFVWLNPSMDSLPNPTAQAYDSGATFRGLFLHELSHAAIGLGDMYNNPEGNHPGLLMGTGWWNFNQYALGDIDGAIAKGCRPYAEKVDMINRLNAQYAG